MKNGSGHFSAVRGRLVILADYLDTFGESEVRDELSDKYLIEEDSKDDNDEDSKDNNNDTNEDNKYLPFN